MAQNHRFLCKFLVSGSTQFSPNIVSTPASHHYQGHVPHVQQSTNVSYPNFELSTPFVFSAKHNGLYLYLGRILKPIWNRRCIEKICLDGKTVVVSNS